VFADISLRAHPRWMATGDDRSGAQAAVLAEGFSLWTFTTTAQIHGRGKTVPAFDKDTADSHEAGRNKKAGRSGGARGP
jgi:hypothetical protein